MNVAFFGGVALLSKSLADTRSDAVELRSTGQPTAAVPLDRPVCETGRGRPEAVLARVGVLKERIELQVADSPSMFAYVARPESAGPDPGLVVFQEALGVNPRIRDVSERFARERHVAIAPELFHRAAPSGFEASYSDFPSVRPHLAAITPEAAEADVRSAYGWLSSNSQVKTGEISGVGFCMGGRVAYIANSVVPLRAAVSFDGGGTPDLLDRASKQAAPILLFWAELDKNITAEKRRAVADALAQLDKRFVNVQFSQANHGFFCDQRSAYEPRSAREAWALTLEFLRS